MRATAWRVIRVVRWPLVLVPIFVVVMLLSGAGRGCLYDRVPHFPLDRLESAVINTPPLTPKTKLDLSEPGVKEKLFSAYEELSPWGEEQGRVFPDLELRLQLSDGRTIGVAYQKDAPQMLVRVYRGEKLTSEVHVRGALMYEFLLPFAP